MSCPQADAADLAVTQDTLFGGRLRITQPARGHRAGTDAVLLAATVPTTSGLIIDAGAGVGTIGLVLALRNIEARTMLLERDATFAALARRNVSANQLDERVSVTETDLLATLIRRSAGVRNESADVVVSNPPFYESHEGRVSADPLKRGAHVIDGDLAGWVRACTVLLKPRGTLCMIHRPDALAVLLSALGRTVGGIRLRAVHPRDGESASRVLLTAVKGSRAPLEVLPPLVLHDRSGAFTPEAAALHTGDNRLT